MGESGSGKTTFLSTIDNFYQPSKIFQIPDTIALIDVADYIENKYINGQNNQIFVLLERDNPDEIESNVRRFFENLRRLFRKSEGQIVLLWPITDKKHALSYSEIGWEVGRDSVVDSDTRGIYNFTGLPKNDFEEVADITARSFNEGRGLEVFGLNSTNIPEILSRSLTISDFYGNLEKQSQEINLDFDKIIKEKIIPAVWILVLGDDVGELGLTVATLTKGNKKQVDIDRLIDLLDSPENNSAYLVDWRERRETMPYLFQRLDVRLFEISPSLSVAVQRVFGEDIVKARFTKKNYTKAQTLNQVRSAKFYQAIKGETMTNRSKLNKPSEGIPEEYRRVQSLESKSDKMLNKAMADAIRATLLEDGISAEVFAEKRSIQQGSQLQPDIHIRFPDGRIICLEPTWRTVGQEKGEDERSQNTMTVGHIQQYLLAKVLEYVKDLGL